MSSDRNEYRDTRSIGTMAANKNQSRLLCARFDLSGKFYESCEILVRVRFQVAFGLAPTGDGLIVYPVRHSPKMTGIRDWSTDSSIILVSSTQMTIDAQNGRNSSGQTTLQSVDGFEICNSTDVEITEVWASVEKNGKPVFNVHPHEVR